MAFRKSAYTGVFADNHQEFICDTTDDIQKLPKQTTKPDHCPAGSRAFVIEDSSRWMLNTEGVWKRLASAGGGGGLGDLDLNIATDPEVESMLDDVFQG